MPRPGLVQIGKAGRDWRVRCIAAPRNHSKKHKRKGFRRSNRKPFLLENLPVVKTVTAFSACPILSGFLECFTLRVICRKPHESVVCRQDPPTRNAPRPLPITSSGPSPRVSRAQRDTGTHRCQHPSLLKFSPKPGVALRNSSLDFLQARFSGTSQRPPCLSGMPRSSAQQTA